MPGRSVESLSRKNWNLEKIQSIKTEPLNVADELLKWAELKEKGLISEDEFKKAKEKILDGKL
jgi:hypothetical protein